MVKLARDKHFSLLCKFVNYGRKKFYNIERRRYASICSMPYDHNYYYASKAKAKASMLEAFTAQATVITIVIYDINTFIVKWPVL